MKYILIVMAVLFLGCSGPKETLNGVKTTTKDSHSQASFFHSELKWYNCDSIMHPAFQDTNQLIQWGFNRGSQNPAQSKNCYIRNHDVFILIVDGCSGAHCFSIYIYELKNKLWQFITGSVAVLPERIIIKVDNEQEKIIFKIDSTQIGELPFDIFDINYDKPKQ